MSLRLAPLLLASALLGAGCLGDATLTEPTELATQAATTPPVVIALLDTGVNVYHEAFRGGPGFAGVDGFDAPTLHLTLDAPGYDEAVEADAAAWEGVGLGQLVAFEGTRLAGISFGTTIATPHLHQSSTEGRYAILDAAGHGTVTMHAALEAAPHAVGVMVQVEDDEQLVDAMAWVAKQPWIDVVSVSMGTWATEYAMGEARMGLAPAYAEAARAGKLIFNGAGNEPIPHMVGEHSGPPFVVAVGGAENVSRGDTRIAARFPDVVGAFWHPSRAEDDALDEYGAAGGTSLACPLVAGTAAEALWLAREAGATPDAQALREALEARADLWGAQDWSPDPGNLDDLLFSNPVVLGPAQIGWGHVEAAHAAEVAAMLSGALELPAKGPEVVAFMGAREEARRAAWGDA